MRGYVASWFFPPATCTEGIVTYKLLRRSSHQYDVCCSTSDLWGYKFRIEIDASNIRVFPLKGDSLEKWTNYAIETFEKLHANQPYDFFMTRSYPPQSIQVGLAIKKKHPELKWICSMGDPIANNPYELASYVDENPLLNAVEKTQLRLDLLINNFKKWETLKDFPSIQFLIALKKIEDAAFEKADLVICPTNRQIQYMMRGRQKCDKTYAVPHTFEKEFFSDDVKPREGEQIIIAYLGSTDKRRTLKPLVQALKWINDECHKGDILVSEKNSYKKIVEKLHFRFVGVHPTDIKDMVSDFNLDEQVEFVPEVSYMESLHIMKESDWLLHTDAYFPDIQPGGSIFFAGKLADYLGSKRRILGLVGKGSPADIIINASGGISIYDFSPKAIAKVLLSIANGEQEMKIPDNEMQTYRSRFDAENVSKDFDSVISNLVQKNLVPQDNYGKKTPPVGHTPSAEEHAPLKDKS